MIAATAIGIFMVPLLFVIIRRKFGPKTQPDTATEAGV
jgi:hypothetical protein